MLTLLDSARSAQLKWAMSGTSTRHVLTFSMSATALHWFTLLKIFVLHQQGQSANSTQQWRPEKGVCNCGIKSALRLGQNGVGTEKGGGVEKSWRGGGGGTTSREKMIGGIENSKKVEKNISIVADWCEQGMLAYRSKRTGVWDHQSRLALSLGLSA